MDVEQFREGVRRGEVSADRLLDLLESTLRLLEKANARNAELERRLESLGQPTTTKLDEPYSVEAEEKRQAQRDQKKAKPKRRRRRGRKKTADKIAQATRTEAV